ncbi:MAG: hypothetical protein ACI8S6_001470 [Myxococcota bacterium]|jgi:hypothetical protein
MRSAVQTLLQQLPTPSSAAALSDLRDTVLSEQLERVQVERASIASRYRMDRSGGHDVLVAMVERLLEEHQALLAARIPDEGPVRYWHALDERLRQSIPAPSSDPHISAPRRIRALRGAARLDRLSGAVDRVCGMLPAVVRDGRLRVLDLNTGHGDLATGLARWAQANSVTLELSVSDDREGMLDYAAARVSSTGLPARTEAIDLDDPVFPKGRYDLICGWGLVARMGARAGVIHWEATQAAGAVLMVEGWRSPERMLLAPLLAARLSGMQEALHNSAAHVTPQEMRLLTAGALGKVQIETFPPGVIAALWMR